MGHGDFSRVICGLVDGLRLYRLRFLNWSKGHCHAALGLRSDRWPNNRADEENQLQRVSFPA